MPSAQASKAYDDCIEQAGPINNSIVFGCAEQAEAPIRKQMNRVYAQLHADLKAQEPSLADKLEVAQKAWLEYRNRQCELEGWLVGTPMQPICSLEMNETRLQQLKDWLQQRKTP